MNRLLCHISLFFLAVTSLVAVSACSASEVEEPGTEKPAAMATLHLRIAPRVTSRAPQDPANSLEKMLTARIIITDSKGRLEYNAMWDLTKDPAILLEGVSVPVRANDLKTVIIVANEQGKVINVNGSKIAAADYFSSLNPEAGASVDRVQLSRITMSLADNDDASGCLTSPLPMSAVHKFYIGSASDYSATFAVHRAAVKYVFRFINTTGRSCTLNSLSIGKVASGQYLFPDADFTSAEQTAFTAYRTPDGVSTATRTWSNLSLGIPGDGKAVETGEFYLPEGPSFAATDPYTVSFVIDGKDSRERTLTLPDGLTPMTDLPRNHYVQVNVYISNQQFDVVYKVCYWEEHTVDIPSFT